MHILTADILTNNDGRLSCHGLGGSREPCGLRNCPTRDGLRRRGELEGEPEGRNDLKKRYETEPAPFEKPQLVVPTPEK